MKETKRTIRIYSREETEDLFKGDNVVYVSFDRHTYELKLEIEE